MSEPIVIGCVRVNEPQWTEPIHGSTRQRCPECNEEIWVSPTSRQIVSDGAVAMCLWCVAVRDMIEPEPIKFQAPTLAQRAELALNRLMRQRPS